MADEGIRLHADQGHWKCPICGRSEILDYQQDHDHRTGKERGVLCRDCNLGLGLFRDEADALRKAADYVEAWAKGKGPTGFAQDIERLIHGAPESWSDRD